MKQLTDRELETIWAHYATMAPAGARRVACMRAAIAADREINGITGEAQPAERAKGQEAVAYLKPGEGDYEKAFSWNYNERNGYTQPLYTTPPTPPAGVPNVLDMASNMQVAIANGDLPDQCEAASDWLVKTFAAPQPAAQTQESKEPGT